MALPPPNPTSSPSSQPQLPRQVLDAKKVDLALVRFTDEFGAQVVSLAVVGENTVHLLESSQFGFGMVRTPQGSAKEWLKKGIFEKLGKE